MNFGISYSREALIFIYQLVFFEPSGVIAVRNRTTASQGQLLFGKREGPKYRQSPLKLFRETWGKIIVHILTQWQKFVYFI